MTQKNRFKPLNEALEVGDRYILLQAEAESSPASPAFVLGPTPAELSRFFFNETVVFGSGCYFLEKTCVTGAGFPVKNDVYLTAPEYGLSKECILRHTDISKPSNLIYRQGRAISVSCPGYMVYGHWLTDILPKLYLLQKISVDIRVERFVIPDDAPAIGIEWLRRLGIRDEQIIFYDPYRDIVEFDELIFPLPLRANSRASPLFNQASEFILNHVSRFAGEPQSSSPQHLYLSRQHIGQDKRHLTNAPQIERVAQANGYTVIYPEEHDIVAQVALFRHAKTIIGEYGSALHGTVFASAARVVCALRSTEIDPGFLQSGLCQVVGQPCGYVYGETSVSPNGHQYFSINPVDFEAAIRIIRLL